MDGLEVNIVDIAAVMHHDRNHRTMGPVNLDVLKIEMMVPYGGVPPLHGHRDAAQVARPVGQRISDAVVPPDNIALIKRRFVHCAVRDPFVRPNRIVFEYHVLRPHRAGGAGFDLHGIVTRADETSVHPDVRAVGQHHAIGKCAVAQQQQIPDLHRFTAGETAGPVAGVQHRQSRKHHVGHGGEGENHPRSGRCLTKRQIQRSMADDAHAVLRLRAENVFRRGRPVLPQGQGLGDEQNPRLKIHRDIVGKDIDTVDGIRACLEIINRPGLGELEGLPGIFTRLKGMDGARCISHGLRRLHHQGQRQRRSIVTAFLVKSKGIGAKRHDIGRHPVPVYRGGYAGAFGEYHRVFPFAVGNDFHVQSASGPIQHLHIGKRMGAACCACHIHRDRLSADGQFKIRGNHDSLGDTGVVIQPVFVFPHLQEGIVQSMVRVPDAMDGGAVRPRLPRLPFRMGTARRQMHHQHPRQKIGSKPHIPFHLVSPSF